MVLRIIPLLFMSLDNGLERPLELCGSRGSCYPPPSVKTARSNWEANEFLPQKWR